MAAPREHVVIDPAGQSFDVQTQSGTLEVRNGVGWTWSKDAAQEASERIPQGQHVEREEPYPSSYGRTLFVMGRCRGCEEEARGRGACGLHRKDS